MNSARFVVTGTDTGIGKTIFAAALAQAIGASYWKPIQAGLEDGSDSQTVAAIGGVPPARILPEAWRLATPASPHLAAEIDGVTIDPVALEPPEVAGPLVIEGAGGLMVPIDRRTLMIDLFARWGLPVILCARTTLGTINHSLLSLAALKARGMRVHGIAFVGEAHADNEATIAAMSGVRALGRLSIAELTPTGLAAAFAEGFDVGDFQ